MATIATDKDEEEKTSYMEDLKVDAHTLQGKEGREKIFSRRVPGSSEKRLTGKGEKLNTSQAEPVAANSWAVGQFPSISCEAFL